MTKNEALQNDCQDFGLNAEKWTVFMAALDAPARIHPRLHCLLNEPSVFENNSPVVELKNT